MRYTLLFLVLFACEVRAYDVVLRDGKVIAGTIIRETAERIILKEASGMFRSLNKTDVDLEKTQKANNGKTPDEDKVNCEDKDKSPIKRVTEEDLKKLREKYDWGNNTTETETAESQEKKRLDEQKKKEKEAAEEEQKKIDNYAARIARLRSSEISALHGCGTALLQSGVIVTDTRGNVLNYLTNSSDLPLVCVDLIEIEEEVQETKEQARRDGVPMQYLDEW
jgi:hypothetical protein